MHLPGSRAEIVLIGPVRSGKSTLGGLLAARLELPQVSLDELRIQYAREIGYRDELAAEIRRTAGMLALVFYRELFAAHGLERMLSEHHNCVFDLGGGVFESMESLARVKRALEPFRNVVLLLPSPDQEESLRILRERDSNPPADLKFDYLRHSLDHPAFYELASLTIYTAGKSPDETCAEIRKRAW